MKKATKYHKKAISSSLTFFYKCILSTLWIGLFGLATFTQIGSRNIEGMLFLIVWVAGTLFIYWGCIRLKHVKINQENIYISNYFKTIAVPLSEIKQLSENCFINIHPIWITFHNPTDFGQKIMFMPKFSFNTFILLSHPIIDELLTSIKHKKQRTENTEEEKILKFRVTTRLNNRRIEIE